MSDKRSYPRGQKYKIHIGNWIFMLLEIMLFGALMEEALGSKDFKVNILNYRLTNQEKSS